MSWLRQPLGPLPFLFLFLYLLKWCWPASDCQWRAVVNRFDNLGGDRDVFFKQYLVERVSELFKQLVDSAIDLDDKNAHYFGFPYYLKINLSCSQQDPASVIRTAFFSGLIPLVTVTFEEPVHSVKQKPEELQIRMEAAPYRISGICDSEVVCQMCWYVPMAMMNGSVVMSILVDSNGIGLPIDSKRFQVNVNGFMKETDEGPVFTIGEKLYKTQEFISMSDPSRPLWYTYNHAPVLILGGISINKIILLSDTEFDDFFPIEVGIDSCWISSINCPRDKFSSGIYDTIATESTLFIRQNQLLYYFTGHYPTLSINTSGSEQWTRVLASHCIRMLNPVEFSKNNFEYVIALGGGWEKGQFFLISVKDGIVTESKPTKQTACSVLKRICSIQWAVFVVEENLIVLLVKTRIKRIDTYFIVGYYQDQETYRNFYRIPQKIPKSTNKGFVMLVGLEQYTDIKMEPRGLSFNPFTTTLHVWGNIILQSTDMVNYLYLAGFPSHAFIKYFVQSYSGQYACVTDNEEIWAASEGSSFIRRVFPSDGWTVYRNLALMHGSQDFGEKEATISIFYNKEGLQQLVYMEDSKRQGRLIKRKFPFDEIITYEQAVYNPYSLLIDQGKPYIKFSHPCPFSILRAMDLPLPQRFTRMERYHAKPPNIMDPSGFHSPESLAVYQGLVFQLLWLHSDYNRPYADPVHDPTWRWWKNKKQDEEYYFYVAGSRNASGGLYVDMASYVKIYSLKPNNILPPKIYLDKLDTFTFTTFLSIRTTKEGMGESVDENSLMNVWLTVIVSHPQYLSVDLKRKELISRGSVLYEVTVQDIGSYPFQDLSGRNLFRSSVILTIIHSTGNCYHYGENGPRLRGRRTLPIIIGCPPGKRLAFDITATLANSLKKNKRYFDCANPDPEMPCFFYSDVFHPYFLIQDMVTGDSGHFMGSYIFMIIGGGPNSMDNITYFSKEEILEYNTGKSSRIWLQADTNDGQTTEEGFPVLSYGHLGIIWVCQEGSPCYDVTPLDLFSPHYFFVVKVTNRGVDSSTYCDYALEFIIHIHGLRLSPVHSIFLMQVSMATVIGLVILYMLIYILAPRVKAFAITLFKRVEEAMIIRAESSLTMSSSGSSQLYPSNLSDVSSVSSPDSTTRK